MLQLPYFPTVDQYADVIRELGWDTVHLAMVAHYGIKAADALDLRYRAFYPTH